MKFQQLIIFGALQVTLLLSSHNVVLCNKELELRKASVFLDRTIDEELSQRHVFSERDWNNLAKKLQAQNVVKLERGCGRSKNMLAILEDGTRVCCRYREHQAKELRGEVYSYFFNRLLGLWNAPPSVLVQVDFSSATWRQVSSEALANGWKDKSLIVMTKFVDDIGEVFIPTVLRDRNLNVTHDTIKKAALSKKDLLLLAQWSDFIMQDFIIGHTDRLFNTLFNLQWNPTMMDVSVHNLKQTKSGQLVLLDNESSFWMGYSLQEWDPLKYEFQIHFLSRLCVFRESTVEKIHQLQTLNDNSRTADEYFEHFIDTYDQFSFEQLPKLTAPFRQEFVTRINIVLTHIQSCVKH